MKRTFKCLGAGTHVRVHTHTDADGGEALLQPRPSQSNHTTESIAQQGPKGEYLNTNDCRQHNMHHGSYGLPPPTANTETYAALPHHR